MRNGRKQSFRPSIRVRRPEVFPNVYPEFPDFALCLRIIPVPEKWQKRNEVSNSDHCHENAVDNCFGHPFRQNRPANFLCHQVSPSKIEMFTTPPETTTCIKQKQRFMTKQILKSSRKRFAFYKVISVIKTRFLYKGVKLKHLLEYGNEDLLVER